MLFPHNINITQQLMPIQITNFSAQVGYKTCPYCGKNCTGKCCKTPTYHNVLASDEIGSAWGLAFGFNESNKHWIGDTEVYIMNKFLPV